ncbi:hypothetical protein ACHQM5_029494 [Ranunculus cassubicifolius]
MRKDVFWKYVCNSKDDNWLTCIFCRKEFSGGIINMKYHWVGMEENDVPSCVRVFKSVKDKALASMSKPQMSSRVNKRAKGDDFPLPPSKVPNSYNQRGKGAAVNEPSNFVRAMDNPTDGDSCSTSDENEALAIAKALKLENEFFSIVMQPSYRKYLPIPTEFGKKYIPFCLKNVKLSYSGKTWTLGCSIGQNQYKLVKGWPICRKQMNIEDNNFCVFEKAKGQDILLNVYIIPERKSIYEMSASSSGGGENNDDGDDDNGNDEGGDDDDDDDDSGSKDDDGGSDSTDDDGDRGNNDDDSGSEDDGSVDGGGDDDDIQILDELNIDSKTSLAADIANTKMHDDLYEEIVSRYGRLEGNLPRNLHFTAGMKKDILQIVLDMIRTKPLDLSDSIITRWEQIVQTATNINFNVGWLVAILAKMRMNLNTNMNVKLQEEKVERLKRDVHSLKEKLAKAKKDFEIACSDLQKLKVSKVPVDFEFDCTPFMGRPQ